VTRFQRWTRLDRIPRAHGLTLDYKYFAATRLSRPLRLCGFA
jgi:hypothetical protein